MEDQDIIRMDTAQETSWYWYGKKRLFSYFIKKHAGAELKILDVGCGSGAMLGFLKKYGQVYGLDASKKAVSICKRLGYFDVKCCLADKMSYSDSSFDIVVLSDILEHVEEDRAVLQEAGRVLKSNGIALITVPASQKLWSKNDEVLHHKRRYSRQQLKQLADGFKVRKVSYIHFLQYFPVRFFKSLRGSKIEWEASGEGRTVRGRIVGSLLKAYSLMESSLIKYFNLPIGVGLIMVLEK